MRRTFIASLLTALALPAAAATIGGVQYATQYDFNEFRIATEGRTFQVEIGGNPFPQMAADDSARQLLPILQANKPRPRGMVFTYDKPAERPRPHYRLALIFDPANDLGGDAVCRGEVRNKPPTPGRVYVFGVYCRNDMAMSQTTGWANAQAPNDPEVGALFSQLFRVLFDDSPARLPQIGGDRR
jgi:hypothetical protein